MHDGSDMTDQIRDHGIAPAHQQHWDWKAAGNFVCGGAGASLFLFAAILGQGAFPLLGSLALAIVGVGLLLLLLKIGRPLRSLYVLRQPRRSWMAREAWIAGAFFPLGVLAVWSEAPALTISAAVAAGLFLLSQAMILKDAKGIPDGGLRSSFRSLSPPGLRRGAAFCSLPPPSWHRPCPQQASSRLRQSYARRCAPQSGGSMCEPCDLTVHPPAPSRSSRPSARASRSWALCYLSRLPAAGSLSPMQPFSSSPLPGPAFLPPAAP
jgi:hypothetical protein